MSKINVGNIVVLHRKMVDWEWYTKPEVAHLFVHLILTANWKDSTYRGKTIKRGQVAVGRRKLSARTGLTERAVRTALKRLKSSHDISIETSREFSIITINNYDDYQLKPNFSDPLTSEKSDQQNDQLNDQQVTHQMTHGMTTSNKVNKKNKKNKVNKKEKPIDEIFQEELIQKSFSAEERAKLFEFYEFRKRLKKPLKTRYGVLGLLKKAANFNGNLIAVIQQSIDEEWQGLFELKDSGSSVEKGSDKDKERVEVLRRFLGEEENVF